MSKRDDWHRVNKRSPCPICGRKDWCLIAVSGNAVICARTESPKRVGDAGWLHWLNVPAPPPPPKPRKAATPVTDWQAFSDTLIRGTSDTALGLLSNALGVSVPSLRRLGAGWSPRDNAWAFPMRNPDGETIGIRLRNDAGKKWAVLGGNNGLLIPDGQVGEECREVLVCEGPTTCAALLDMGFYAIGRPSCSAYVAETVTLLSRRAVTLLVDHDEPKRRPDGTVWYPGQVGADALALALHGHSRWTKLVHPLVGKDARDWYRAGCTGPLLRSIIDSTAMWRPEKEVPYRR